jgi:hypothetical protein
MNAPLAVLDNIAWHTLVGPHAAHAAGAGDVRRYARGFSAFAAFADVAHPDFDALAPYCDVDERFYTAGWSGAVPGGSQVEHDATMLQMRWAAPVPEAGAASDAVALDAAVHGAQALELATLTRPGPFGPRTVELGDYLGLFDGGRLVAMAGERMAAGGWREVSGVCTQMGFARHQEVAVRVVFRWR